MVRRIKAKIFSMIARAASVGARQGLNDVSLRLEALTRAVDEIATSSRNTGTTSRPLGPDILSDTADVGFQPNHVFLGGNMGITTVDHGHKLYVDTRDRYLAPQMVTNSRWNGGISRLFRQVLKAGDIVIDVGSSVGYFVTLAADLVGDRGHVHAFEPHPEVATLLAMSIGLNSYGSIVTAHATAVSDRHGTVDLVTFPDRQTGSLLGQVSENVSADNATITVETSTLDAMLPDVSDVRLMRFDVGGAELSALSGARGLIEASPRLVIVVGWHSQEADLAELRWLTGRGFKLYLMQDSGPPRITTLAEIGSLDRCELLLHRGTMYDMGYGAGLHEYPPEHRPPARTTLQPFDGRRIGVAGLFRTRCGLQRGAELMVADLRAKGHSVVAIDLSRVLHKHLTFDMTGLLDPSDTSDLMLTDLIVHINPPLFLEARAKFPYAVVDSACIVGYWAWELTVISDQWRQAARYCDAIWVPSPFVADALKAGLPDFEGDIRVVPHAVDRDPIPALDIGSRVALRAKFGFRPADFVVGFTFAFGSNFVRKNPIGAIDAFCRAFEKTDASCRLVIRTHEVVRNERLFEHLVSYVRDDDRITIVDVAETPFPIIEFYNCLDVFLSLHRSEGYGLAIAEAAQAGVRSIVTGWGLAPDIRVRPEVWTVDSRLVTPLDLQNTYSEYAGAMWAEPDIAQAARLLQQARAERAISA